MSMVTSKNLTEFLEVAEAAARAELNLVGITIPADEGKPETSSRLLAVCGVCEREPAPDLKNVL